MCLFVMSCLEHSLPEDLQVLCLGPRGLWAGLWIYTYLYSVLTGGMLGLDGLQLSCYLLFAARILFCYMTRILSTFLPTCDEGNSFPKNANRLPNKLHSQTIHHQPYREEVRPSSIIIIIVIAITITISRPKRFHSDRLQRLSKYPRNRTKKRQPIWTSPRSTAKNRPPNHWIGPRFAKNS